ncbi:hypothetical protein GCM10010360_74390 [Streptomyces nogalater]
MGPGGAPPVGRPEGAAGVSAGGGTAYRCVPVGTPVAARATPVTQRAAFHDRGDPVRARQPHGLAGVQVPCREAVRGITGGLRQDRPRHRAGPSRHQSSAYQHRRFVSREKSSSSRYRPATPSDAKTRASAMDTPHTPRPDFPGGTRGARGCVQQALTTGRTDWPSP